MKEILILLLGIALISGCIKNETIGGVEETQIETGQSISDVFIEPETVRASHILVDTKEEAEDIIEKLENGADFGDLAKEYSIGPSGKNEGDLGTFGKGMMVKPFEDAAFSLIVDEISEPVQTQFGWHVIKRFE